MIIFSTGLIFYKSQYFVWNTGYYVDLTTNSCQKCSTRWKDWNLSSTSCFSCWSFFVDNILDWATYTCVSTCSTNSYYDSSTNTCPAWNNVCKTWTYKTPSTCTSCNKTPGGQQLYLSDGECVVNWPKPYIENTSSNKCERSAFDIVLLNLKGDIIIMVCKFQIKIFAKPYIEKILHFFKSSYKI